MNTRPEPPDWAEDAPELFTDRDKLARAMRAASIAGNIQRCNALKARADVLRAERAEEIAKADDETLGRIVKDKPEAAEWLTRTFLENSKTVTQAKTENERLAQEITQRERERRKKLRATLFEDSPLADLAISTPKDFAQELGRSENYITDTAKKLKLQKTAGRWVFVQGDAERDPMKLYDYLTRKMRDGFTAI